MLSKEFNLEDYLDMMSQIKKLGPINKLMEMIPGINAKELKGIDLSEGERGMKKEESIINSMTVKERRNPSLISNSPSRKKRIALGSGTNIQSVSKLLKDFDMKKKLMKQFGGMQKKGNKKGMFGKLPFMN